VIDIEIGIVRPELTLHMPADQDTLPLVRQALRSLGETVDADVEALEDAELAVTEACANAVEHAYADGVGEIEVRFSPGEDELRVSVADQGVGIPVDIRSNVGGDGFGLPMIDSIATSVHFADGDGTEITMALPLGRPEPAPAVDGAVPGVEPAERILRRLVAVVAAQRDMSSERVMEGLLLAELVARNALRYLIGDTVSVHIDLVGDGFELRVGPLEEGGAQAVIDDSEVPVVGSVLERLADDVRVDQTDEGESITLRMNPRG
jgi:serine/threonine-protein kinase RsbW